MDPITTAIVAALTAGVAAGTTEVGKKVIYAVDARGAQVGVIGDGAKVEGGIHFGETKP